MNRKKFISTSMKAAALGFGAAHLEIFPQLVKAEQKMKYSASMWTYLWDLVDEGYDTVLGRLSEVGVNSVSLASAYHAGKFLAPHNPKRKVVFLEDGVIYFKANQKYYGQIKPKEHSLVREGYSLQSFKRYAEKKRFSTRAWIVCCHNTRIGMAYPEAACENVFGDTIFHNLCPNNPLVRHYLRGLVKNVAECGVEAIELEALQFQGYTHGYHHEREGIELSAGLRFLLGCCFCSSCEKSAQMTGYTLEPLRHFTRKTLTAHFASPGSINIKYSKPEDLPSELVTPFQDWRQQSLLSLIDELMEQAGSCILRPMFSLDPTARFVVGVNSGKTVARTHDALLLGYVRDGKTLRQQYESMRRDFGEAAITLGFQVGLPESGGKKDFLDRMIVAKDLGVNSYNFYNYGFIPLENLQWIKSAL
ncbi:MAG: hypothetical protein V1799_07275 [bacterium]